MNLSKNFVSVQFIEMMIVIHLGAEKDNHIFKTVVLQLASMFVKLITTSFCYIYSYCTKHSTSFFSASQTESFLSHSSIIAIFK